MGYPNKIIDKAYVLYCEGKTQEQIARKLKIKRARTVGDWIEKYGWKERRQKTVEKAAEKADNWRAREMAKAIKGHFDVARGLRTAITKKIPRLIKAKSPNTLDIERLSKALKNTTDVERQALGLATNQIDVNAEIHSEITKYLEIGLNEETEQKLDAIVEKIIVAGQAGAGDGAG
jgi:hypothetical protein